LITIFNQGVLHVTGVTRCNALIANKIYRKKNLLTIIKLTKFFKFRKLMSYQKSLWFLVKTTSMS